MNYYELLNVKESATDSEIKKSYKQLVKKYHPDVYDGNKEFAEKKIKELNQAYEILSDKSSRDEYDRVLNSVREETSKIFETKDNNSNDDYEIQKQNIEKKYNEMYNYDYYKKYSTNYYGVDKSNQINNDYYNYNSNKTNDFINKATNNINNTILRASPKLITLVSALIIIIVFSIILALLSKVKELMSDSSKTFNELVDAPSQNYTIQSPYNTYPTETNSMYGTYGNDITYENYLQDFYGEYENYFSALTAEFDGVVKKGISVYQVIAFYGDPIKYVENNTTMTLYYNDSYIVCNSLGIVIDYFNNGYFMTEED